MTNPVLEVRDVGKRFGALEALAAVSFDLHSGERLAIIGPNGAGKSTLIKAIMGRTHVSKGDILFRGETITNMPEYRRSRIGMGTTFQRSDLFEGLTVIENVAVAVQRRHGLSARILPRREDAARIRELSSVVLEQVGLGPSVAARPSELAHGQRRQLELAIALASGPTLLLLDEPAAGMSARERDTLISIVRKLPRHLSVLLVEHDMDVVFALAERIIVLDAGRILAVGTPDEVRDNLEVQIAYFGGDADAETSRD